jgi:DNA repair protein RecN (Recombination protein N)
MELYERLTARLTRIQNASALIEQLEDKLMDAKREYNKNSQALSKARKEGAVRLSNAITAEFPPLKLQQAEFLVEVEDLPNNLWGPTGINNVVFTARTNKGMPFGSIARIASGGELARMILALKVILQKLQATPTLIFDEVDTGLGGAASAAVGQRLALLAQDTQVLVITHSPQVASRGARQMVVSKREVNNVTLTQVRELSDNERIDELARMLAGATITKAAKAAAQALLDEAAEPIKLSYEPAPSDDPIIPTSLAASVLNNKGTAQTSA